MRCTDGEILQGTIHFRESSAGVRRYEFRGNLTPEHPN